MIVDVIMPRMDLLKRYTQFSIAALLCVMAVVAIFMAHSTKRNSPLDGYIGVWQVAQGVDNTAYIKSKIGVTTMALVDTQGSELVLTSTRLFFVSSFKTSAYEILVSELGNETKLKLRELNSGLTTHAILRRTGSNLSFAFVDATTTQIDETVNGNQIVYSAQLLDEALR